jgi:hypothetical protein
LANFSLPHAYPLGACHFTDCSLLRRVLIQAEIDAVVRLQDVWTSHHEHASAALGVKRHYFILLVSFMILFLGDVGFQPDRGVLSIEQPFSYCFIQMPNRLFIASTLFSALLVVILVSFFDRCKFETRNVSNTFSSLGFLL